MFWLSRQEARKEYDKWEMRAKIMNLYLQKTRRKYESERWLQFMKN